MKQKSKTMLLSQKNTQNELLILVFVSKIETKNIF